MADRDLIDALRGADAVEFGEFELSHGGTSDYYVDKYRFETDTPYAIVRKERKEYGTGNRIEGDLADGERVVVLEDIATTGESALSAVRGLREAGAIVDRVLVVVDREEGARRTLAEADAELASLVTASALLDDA